MESIKHSVGQGGANRPDDVAIVQDLLNRAHGWTNVPKQKLDVDGIAGPLTVAAIREFQQQNCKVVDGKVDPYAETITKLNQIARELPPLNDGVSYLTPKTPKPPFA